MFLATITKKKGPILSYLADAWTAEGFEIEKESKRVKANDIINGRERESMRKEYVYLY